MILVTSHSSAICTKLSNARPVLLLTILFLSFSVATYGQTSETVVASVNGKAITLQQVDEAILAQLYPLQQQIYALRKSSLENLITSRLLHDEARKRGVSIEKLREQFTTGEVTITIAQVEESFTKNVSYFAAMSPDEAKERLRLDLESKARMKHYRRSLDELRNNATISIALEQPVLQMLEAEAPTRGAPNPVVTIVEFSDFECPYCREVQHSLKQILDSYRDSVKLVFRHLPLETHRNSLLAARAAYCAGEQNKFWPFHDALFDADRISAEAIAQIGVKLSLDSETFQSCLNSERSKTAVSKDIHAAQQFRIDATPGFVINGRIHSGALSLKTFHEIVESELNHRNRMNSSSAN